MGFSSWLTADTGESIMNRHSDGPHRTVYMLTPEGGAPVREDSYDGYCRFGDTTAFAHLARMNLPAERLEGLDEDEIDRLGCELDTGVLVLVADGSRHRVCAVDVGVRPGVSYHHENYGQPIDAFGGRSANDLIASGELVETEERPARPLKFSFRADASYDALPASDNCPRQGFF